MMRVLLVVLAVGLGWWSPVLAGTQNGGLAVSYVTPKGDFDQVVGDGIGLSSIFDYPLGGNVVNISGSLAYYRFSGITLLEGTNVKSESTSLWEFSGGPQLDFGRLYMGVEAGYYTNLDEWGLVPNLGLRKDMVDVSFRYKMTDDGKFMAVRVGFFF